MVRDNMDLQERVSYIQSFTKPAGDKDGDFAAVKTPGELEDGALVAGGALDLFSRQAFGIFSNYAAIGVILGMIPSLNYPIFNIYLNLEGYQTSAYSSLVTLGWSFKVFMGMLSDCVPIFGFRRKSWMLIGWGATMVCLSIMTFSSLGDPYCSRLKAKAMNNSLACTRVYTRASPAEKELFNLGAPDQGSLFIILSMFVSLGYVTAACASDAMVTEYSQREPDAIRGRVLTGIYTVRTIASILSQVVIGFGLNGADYGGSFSFSMAPNVPYGICLAPCVLVVLSVIFILEETKVPGTPFREWAAGFWGLLQKRVMWQICAFRFISQVLTNISSTADSPMSSTWAKVEPINSALAGIAGNAIFAGIMVVVGKWGLHWNWRWVIATCTVCVLSLDGITTYLTIWNVVRNQWFYTGFALTENIPGGIRFVVSTYCAVEIADVGNEGATFGLVTTVNNLASPFGSMLTRYINSFFKVLQNDIREDSSQVRWDVTYTFLISYACRLSALAFLFMLPPQRGPMQELKKKGGKSKLAGIILILIFAGTLAVSVTSSIMAIYPQTRCLRIAGGNGVTDAKTGKCPVVASRKG
ncbi:hypothetical protein DYB25_004646 [Aphanomyces astaci]|uniref:Major facilitator superfamily (MFS) profile domain-containing protein n=1 Tax=Aphanomyces astaci TaxID=112090 RepID=A0A397E992_APHAT|nr:hypothetical protein AaE_002563 [Aphanomyces astaci]RHY11430.1 hypothetical protein DYB25_004646 [Aphanomyces astaci]RHY13356.1 hypothetical protein DYB36_005607 [Aphanomyces astaci]RHY36500.1 hypothetical protein DYB34_009617 [Aphanomyces astaci]RHY55880.1 hypothetical protein DYB38_011673 [Aphanomyces astaci]